MPSQAGSRADRIATAPAVVPMTGIGPGTVTGRQPIGQRRDAGVLDATGRALQHHQARVLATRRRHDRTSAVVLLAVYAVAYVVVISADI